MAVQRPTLAQRAIVSGFKKIEAPTGPRRLIVSAQALEKQGKTHFSLTAPGPIGYLSLDIGEEGVVEKFLGSKDIYKVEYGIEIDKFSTDKAIAEEADKQWTRMKGEFLESLRSYRSTVVDTGSEMWELIRLARFGKLTQVMPHHYGPVNAEFRNLIREAYDLNSNLILLHKMKDEWENFTNSQGQEKSRRTGNKKAVQMNDIPFLVQVVVQLWRDDVDPYDWHTTVLDCRQNGGIKGLQLDGEMSNFPTLAQMVFPDTEQADWE